jgi:TetR/AcrR family transcriptional repressor of nem operon
MQASVVSFFDQNEAWLQDVLEQGRGDGSLHFTGPARDVARMIMSCLEGAMLVTRPYGDIPRFQNAAASLMTGLISPSAVQD